MYVGVTVLHNSNLTEEEKERRLDSTRGDTEELLPNSKNHKRKPQNDTGESDSDSSLVVLDTTV